MIQSEVVIPKLDLAWLETGAHYQGPKIALSMIHLMVVQLLMQISARRIRGCGDKPGKIESSANKDE